MFQCVCANYALWESLHNVVCGPVMYILCVFVCGWVSVCVCVCVWRTATRACHSVRTVQCKRTVLLSIMSTGGWGEKKRKCWSVASWPQLLWITGFHEPMAVWVQWQIKVPSSLPGPPQPLILTFILLFDTITMASFKCIYHMRTDTIIINDAVQWCTL